MGLLKKLCSHIPSKMDSSRPPGVEVGGTSYCFRQLYIEKVALLIDEVVAAFLLLGYLHSLDILIS